MVGINVSAMIAKWFPGNDLPRLLAEVAQFCRAIVNNGLRVLLVPHVTNPSADLPWNDEATLRLVLDQCRDLGNSIWLLPGTLPARQVKWMISRCRLFVGARTHATIAAISTGVPTLAIAYSQKARGIWRDVFGNEDYLLLTDQLSCAALVAGLRLLESDRPAIRSLLAEKSSVMLEGARRNASALRALMSSDRRIMSPLIHAAPVRPSTRAG